MSKRKMSSIILAAIFLSFGLNLAFSEAIKKTDRKQVAFVEIKEAITPVSVKYMKRALIVAEMNDYDTLVYILDTPGGMVDSTRLIVQDILSADEKGIDTVVYVSPGGSRAGSAGVFITMSAKYAVMAPGCNIGAAHPVTMGGSKEKDDSKNAEHLSQKIENDTVAFIKSIAATRGRNVQWGIDAVKKSVSITSEEALKANVIDYIAADMDELVKIIYGKKTEYTLHTIEKSWGEKLLSILANPNLAFIFISLGLLAIGIEIRTPGLGFSGALGALLFIVGLYATQVLPINFAGLFLIILAVILFILEISIISYGLLTIGGLISLILGAVMLFDSPIPSLRVSPLVIGSTIFIILAIMGLLVMLIIPSLKNKVVSGREGMMENLGNAITDFQNGMGQVKVHGEIWTAVSKDDIAKGDEIKIISSEGLKLTVKKES